ncbi:MAG: zf-HC2 domain-containing protein [Armatimonadota bacterium]|nr:zf-HC2 domain-containing protein [Armatimonadota bacterium]
MRCERVQEMLSAYQDASLGWLARRRVAAHLAACAACREENRALARTVQLLRQVGGEKVPRDVTAAVMAQVALLPTSAPARSSLGRRAVLVPATALAALALAVGISMREPGNDATRVTSPRAAYVQEYAHFRASQEWGGGVGVLLASELNPDRQ